MKKRKKSQNYDELLISDLKDPKEAIGYLNAILEDCKDGSEESQKILLNALKKVAIAQGGISDLSKKTKLSRESLYKTLSRKGNPKLTTFNTLLNAMGFELKVGLSARR